MKAITGALGSLGIERALLLALGLLCASAAAAQAGGLLLPAEGGLAAAPALPEGTLRSRLARVDLGRLDRARAAALRHRPASLGPAARQATLTAPEPGAAVPLNLFDDVALTAVVAWTEPTFSGGYSLSGRLAEDPLGSVTLVVNGDRVVGSVQAGGRSYRFRSAGGGLLSVSEVEEPPLRCGVEHPQPWPSHSH